jgi:TRAP-type C4-dicarboxylate transport system permease small subunit
VRKTLRWLAVLLALLTLAMWLAGGWNRGWTKTSVMVKNIDPVTEQEIIEWKRQFVPGIDSLGVGLLASLVLLGASFLFRRSPNQVLPT